MDINALNQKFPKWFRQPGVDFDLKGVRMSKKNLKNRKLIKRFHVKWSGNKNKYNKINIIVKSKYFSPHSESKINIFILGDE